MNPADKSSARQRRRLIARGLLSALATAAVMVALYYLLPLGRVSDHSIVAALVAVVAVLVTMIGWQVRAILVSKEPAIRATQSLAATTPTYLLSFAAIYYILSQTDPASFTEALSRTDGIYLTVTIFTTVGFGDISAQSETARLVVTAQMLLNLVVLGLGIKVILGAVTRARSGSTATGG
ncbi:potassium channel family protein [Cellulomonas endometrii]|uniref:potassium channel family protein n=1 Tax=Cellulomonas endometrii TaxID=3036301 RepID=UPI0024ACD90E|nr:potassium channel family protein [Cellulomonas endometrii]